MEVYGLLALGMSLWNQLVVPVLFMVFWLVLFALQIYSYFSTRDQPASRERLLFLFLTRYFTLGRAELGLGRQCGLLLGSNITGLCLFRRGLSTVGPMSGSKGSVD